MFYGNGEIGTRLGSQNGSAFNHNNLLTKLLRCSLQSPGVYLDVFMPLPYFTPGSILFDIVAYIFIACRGQFQFGIKSETS